jgi:hypothetical protein
MNKDNLQPTKAITKKSRGFRWTPREIIILQQAISVLGWGKWDELKKEFGEYLHPSRTAKGIHKKADLLYKEAVKAAAERNGLSLEEYVSSLSRNSILYLIHNLHDIHTSSQQQERNVPQSTMKRLQPMYK